MLVFGIGSPRTGTVTLGSMLQDNLGLKVRHDARAAWEMVPMILSGGNCQARLEEAEAWLDGPWYRIAPVLATHFPEARFVLTWREPNKWLASCLQLFADLHRQGKPYHDWPPGVLRWHHQHFQALNREYFDGSGRCLVVRLCDGSLDQEKLIGSLEAFLDRQWQGERRVPHMNRGELLRVK